MEYRKSRHRDRILQFLKDTNEHPSAECIYLKFKKEIPEISLGTVYRNLKILQEQGCIQKLTLGDGAERFDGQMTTHYHLVCEKCRVIDDFEMPHYNQINEDAEKMSRFKITHHRIEFYGICEKCQNKTENQGSKKEK